MSDEVHVKIGDQEVSFGFVGRSFRLKCVDEIRARRKLAFKDAVGNLPADPVSAASTISTAIDANMTSVIIDDSDVNQWLSTPEGFFFTFKDSAKRSNPDMPDAKVDELHDRLDMDGVEKLRDFWGSSLHGTQYDDIIKRVNDYYENAALQYYGNDANVISAFAEWLVAGRPGYKEDLHPGEDTANEQDTEGNPPDSASQDMAEVPIAKAPEAAPVDPPSGVAYDTAGK